MAKSEEKKAKPPPGKATGAETPAKPITSPRQRAVESLAARVAPELATLQRAEAGAGAPEGAQAGLADWGPKLTKALPHILTGLIEVGAIGADGQVSADEVKQIAGKLFELFRAFRARGPDPDRGPAMTTTAVLAVLTVASLVVATWWLTVDDRRRDG